MATSSKIFRLCRVHDTVFYVPVHYVPASALRLEFVDKVICNRNDNTGYIINVYPERVNDEVSSM